MAQSDNPYHPPVTQGVVADPAKPASLGYSLVSATFAVALSFVLWIVLLLASTRVVPSYLGMPLWAITLIVATTLSICLVNQFRRFNNQPLGFAIAFSLFSIVYLAAEGDVSNGTDISIMALVYGTMLMLPVLAYFTARYLRFEKRSTPEKMDVGTPSPESP